MISQADKNVGYLFYNLLYKEKTTRENLKKNCYKNNEKLKLNNDKIVKAILKTNLENCENVVSSKWKTFKLKTTYPGLLLGSGYNHDTGLEGDFKLGFYFDHTSGLPVIPGSSIKGVLRNAFTHTDYIADTLLDLRENKKISLSEEGIEALNIEKLEKEIFEGKVDEKTLLSMKDRDKFYDAEIVEVKNEKSVIFEDDFLCPHGDDPLKNPTPLRFLKVAPEVVFEFRFDMKNSKTNELITAFEKEELFKQILLDLGVGAKTNVGYGQFNAVPEE